MWGKRKADCYLSCNILESGLTCKIGTDYSKLSTSLDKVSLEFQTLISEIRQYFLLKNVSSFRMAKASLMILTKNISVFGWLSSRIPLS